MGIRDNRFYRAIDRIIKEELQKGNLPSSKEFSWKLEDYLRSYDLSEPEYKFKPARYGSTARAIDYNKTVRSVHNDLSVLYENTIELHNLLSKNFSKFEVDKSKLEYEVNTLEGKLKEMILLYSKNGFLGTTYDMFDDLSKVDLDQTTANVDIKMHEVSIPEDKTTSYKIYPEANVSFHLLPEIEKSVEIKTIAGRPSNVLKDSINETWQAIAYSTYKQPVSGYLYVDFAEKQQINKIEIALQSVKESKVVVEFSPDNINWFTLPYYEEGKSFSSAYSFSFPMLEAYRLRLLITKPEAEELDATVEAWTYSLGIKHLGLYQLNYPSQAVLQTIPMEVNLTSSENFSINKVSLVVEEELPAATDIKYSIAIPTESNQIDWKNISPVDRENPAYEQIIDFRNITNSPALVLEMDENKSLSEFEMDAYYANGIKFYKLGEVEDRAIIDKTERLYPGKNTWGMKRFYKRQENHENHIPSIEDWMLSQSYEYGYVEIKDGKAGLLLNSEAANAQKEYNYMFTVGVLSEKKQEVVTTSPVSNTPIAIYVNGELMFQGIPKANTKVSYLFEYGWNEIVVLAYPKNVGGSKGIYLDLGIDVRQYGSNIYSQSVPMEKVSLHDLRYNIKSNDRNKYAIEVINEKSYIILNHAIQGLIYDFFFDYVEGEAKNIILFKAEFIKNDGASVVSPRLKNYRLRFS